MAKLSAADQAFFLLETPERPMSVGVLMVLAPPRGQARGFADRLLQGMLTRPVGPPFNLRVRPARFGPLLELESDDAIDPSRQLHRHRLRAPGSLKALFARICEIHARLLDRSGPLWELHVFEGLPAGRVALYFKFHHGMMDGLGFLRVLDRIVTKRPQTKRPRAFWEGLGELPAAAPAGLVGLVRSLDETRRTTNDLVRLGAHQVRRALRLGPGLAPAFVATPDALAPTPSRERTLGHCVLGLRRLSKLAHAADAKINDVIMACIDAATHRYLAEHGTAAAAPLVADVPVGLVDHGGAGNRISILQVPMGRSGAGPVERLHEIVAQTRNLKHEVRDLDGNALVLYSILVHSAAALMESLGLDRWPLLANMVISNPQGMREVAYFNGAAIEFAVPVSVVGHHQSLNITATTYVGDVHITFIALRQVMPDLQRLADLTVAALGELERALATERRRGSRR